MGEEEENMGEYGRRPAVEKSTLAERRQFWEQYFQKHTVGDREEEEEHSVSKLFQYFSFLTIIHIF